MNIKYKNETHNIEYRKIPIPHFVFPELEKTGIVSHLFSTRLGGVSKEHLSSLNLSFSRGDDDENVIENYRRVGSVIGCELSDFVTSDQTHTTNVRLVTAADKGCGVTKERVYTDVDGLITNEPGVCLSTFYADCVPLYFVDPVHKAIGLSHSGWRGTVGRMGQATLNAMHDSFGTNPSDVLCAIGPSICQDCYEVSADVADEFIKEFRIKTDANNLLYPTIPGKFQLNLWAANKQVLLDAGIRPENISVTDVCTCCNPELLFSHRASHGMRGNLGAFLMLK